MCGIAGFVDLAVDGDVEARLRTMGEAIAYRGPDDSGTFHDAATGVGFVHRRLAIVDLTSAGHQPMRSSSGRFVIVFNGEIYNHVELRRAFEASGHGVAWNGHSDTETLLRGFEVWGIKETLARAVGMFAFALYDQSKRQLFLARDRMGEKPLYYGISQGVFLFGSELKALRAHPSFGSEIDRDALLSLLRHQYCGGARSIYKSISKLLPGSLLTFDLSSKNFEIEPYWSLNEAARHGLEHRFSLSDQDAIDQFDELLKQSIGLQMMADVPVGAFLSGGVDSSLIVAEMQRQSLRPVKSFTIGFEEDAFNEAPFARAVAHHLGTDHKEYFISPREALDLIPHLPSLYDEPLADVSQIPTFLVSRIARQAVTVSLSGDAGDELFAGYTTYAHAETLMRLHDYIPASFRSLTSYVVKSGARLSEVLGNSQRARQLALSAFVLNVETKSELTNRLTQFWSDESAPVLGTKNHKHHQNPFSDLALSDLERMIANDMITYLPDDILVKVDRAAMAVSLETRVPLLDHRIVEFALSLPMSLRRRDGEGKWIMRQVLDRYVPRALIDRPKKGFGVPLAQWLRGPLREWALDLLSPTAIKRDGLFDPHAIARALDDHMSGRRDRHNDLWSVLVAQQWLEAQRSSTHQ
ncbi:MAG: asparagine synthase (glutamine-hydrolyzing) [Hyphomicrobiales bacterium]